MLAIVAKDNVCFYVTNNNKLFCFNYPGQLKVLYNDLLWLKYD